VLLLLINVTTYKLFQHLSTSMVTGELTGLCHIKGLVINSTNLSRKTHLVRPFRSLSGAKVGRERDAGIHARLDKGFGGRPDMRTVSNLYGPIGTAKEWVDLWEARVRGVFLELTNVPIQQRYQKGNTYGE
jgi:hypothetical protein